MKKKQTKQIEAVRKQLLEKKAVLSKEIEMDMAAFQKQLKVKVDTLNAVEEVLSTFNDNIVSKTVSKEKKKTLVEMTYSLLKRKPMHYQDLLKALQKAGYLTEGKNPEAHILSLLSRDSRFERVKRGVYGVNKQVS